MKAEEKNAYFTVEAALVLPMVISGMLLGIYLFCYQYDRCLLEQDMGSLVLWGSTEAENAGDAAELKRQLQRRAAELYLDKYVAWEMTSVEINLKNDRIDVAGGGNFTFPVPQWNLWNDSSRWKADASLQCARQDPVFFIRQFRKLQRLANDYEK